MDTFKMAPYDASTGTKGIAKRNMVQWYLGTRFLALCRVV